MQGKKEEVLSENKKHGFWLGFTRNYLKVRMRSDEDLKGGVKEIRPVEKFFVN